MIRFIWRTEDNVAVKGTGRAFSVPDDLEGELTWEYIANEGLNGFVTKFDSLGNPLEYGDLGPCYICIGCKTVSFENHDEFRDGRRTGHGYPTFAGNVVAGDLLHSGRYCTKCADSAFRADLHRVEKKS